MIKNQSVLDEVRKDWEGVRNRQTSIFVGLAASRGIGVGIYPFRVADICYSLVLIFAYSVLGTVLRQLKEEGFFTSPKKDNRLGVLIKNSETQLPWVNFSEVDEGHHKRNDVAHKDFVPPRGESWKYIDMIERELVNWQIIPDQKADYSIPWGSRKQKTLNLS
jgi:hypothetical protein